MSPHSPQPPLAAHATDPLDRGALARSRLIGEATRIFAAKGYTGASTREICEAAGVNVAAIHYYFRDKEGLYRAVLLRPIERMIGGFGGFDDPALPFDQALRMFLAPFLSSSGAPRPDEDDTHALRLHLREMLDPTPAFREIVEKFIAPVHHALCGVLARHCGLAQPDTDLRQLAFALVAMANDYCISREFMNLLAPGVLQRPDATERNLDRLVAYGHALLDHEIARRRESAASEESLK
jgi:AcrR family transcriptional regulator